MHIIYRFRAPYIASKWPHELALVSYTNFRGESRIFRALTVWNIGAGPTKMHRSLTCGCCVSSNPSGKSVQLVSSCWDREVTKCFAFITNVWLHTEQSISTYYFVCRKFATSTKEGALLIVLFVIAHSISSHFPQKIHQHQLGVFNFFCSHSLCFSLYSLFVESMSRTPRN